MQKEKNDKAMTPASHEDPFSNKTRDTLSLLTKVKT